MENADTSPEEAIEHEILSSESDPPDSVSIRNCTLIFIGTSARILIVCLSVSASEIIIGLLKVHT